MEFQKFIPEGWQETNDNMTFENINNAKTNGSILQGFVESCDDNFNLHINLGNGIKGIIPRQEVDAIGTDAEGEVEKKICRSKVNTIVQFKVTDNAENELKLSRKAVGIDVMNWISHDLKEGTVIDGIVKNIRPYGAFVDIGGGVTGLLHIEDMSVSRIKSPDERFSIGQKIKVMVKCIDKENSKVILTYKELLGTWEDNIKDFKEGTKVCGIVKEEDKYKNGIFIELKPNLVGMADYKENMQYGQEVEVYIKRIIKDKKKIKLIIV